MHIYTRLVMHSIYTRHHVMHRRYMSCTYTRGSLQTLPVCTPSTCMTLHKHGVAQTCDLQLEVQQRRLLGHQRGHAARALDVVGRKHRDLRSARQRGGGEGEEGEVRGRKRRERQIPTSLQQNS